MDAWALATPLPNHVHTMKKFSTFRIQRFEEIFAYTPSQVKATKTVT